MCESERVNDALTLLDKGSIEILDRALYGLTDSALTGTIRELQTIIGRLHTTQAALIREIDGRGLVRAAGAASPSTWLRNHLHITITEARKLTALGALLDQTPNLATAIADGAMTTDQALAIGDVVGELPADSAPEIIVKVTGILVDYATQFEPSLLRKLGDRVLAHIAPDLADEQLRRRLEHEERQAARDRALHLSPDGRGRTLLRGILDAESAAVLRAALEPLMTPNASSPAGPDPRTAAARRADALVDVCRLALRTTELPTDGGTAPQLNITVDFDTLASALGAGILDTGEPLSAATIRRLACDARILPAVMNSAGVPLDIGRGRRLYTGAARAAILIRDGGCAFPNCDRPPRWTEIHHIVAWSNGGTTDRDNGVALCGFHHRLIHHEQWTIVMGSDMRPDFIPPPHIDPTQTPRRNPYHQRT